MKNLLKIIPLMVMPLVLSSCNVFEFNSLSKDESSETSENTNNSSESSSNSSSGEESSSAISSSESSSSSSSSNSSSETPVDPVLPTSVSISGDRNVYVGDTIALTATVLPENADNKNVIWSSNYTTRATVDQNGVVTGVKSGSVTITAKCAAKESIKATYTITVKNVLPTSVSISGPSTVVAGETISLSATVLPENATNKAVTWKSSSDTYATVSSSGVVTGKKAGSVTITAKCSAATTVTATKAITITAPDPTGVSLSRETLELGYTKSATLTATVAPAAANQTVSWTSSNTSVATVSSSGVVTAKSITGSTTITATTVNGLTATSTVNVSAFVSDKWTIMVYICGADFESDGGYASGDIDEICAVNNKPDDVNIILETGGSKSWTNSKVNNKKDVLARWEVENNNITFKTSVSKASMGLTSTLQSFVTWGLQEYPAERVGLILWNHGGAMGGVCFDENFNDDSLTANEVDTAITNARNAADYDSKLEFITYDACLMAIQDIAVVNANNFNYMLSSQESEVGNGYDYDAWLPTLYGNPNVSTTTVLNKIADTFIDENGGVKYRGDQTQSVYDLSKAASYKTTFEAFASKLSTVVSNYGWSTFSNIVTGSSVKTYGDASFDIYNLTGTKGLTTAMLSESKFNSMETEIENLESAVSALVVHETHQAGTNGCGVCIAVPATG